jgi:hypothetical protein
MARGKCVACQFPTIAANGADADGSRREHHFAVVVLSGSRVGYAVEQPDKPDVLICSHCLPALIGEALRRDQKAA